MKLEASRLMALKNQIRMAETFNKEELEPLIQEAIARYCGWYVPPIGIDWDVVINEVYPIIQNELPSIFFRNPRAFLKPRNKTYMGKKRNPISGQMEEVEIDSAKSAKTQEDILNYTITQIPYKRETRKILIDALLFPYGILWHGYKGDFGMTEEQAMWVKDKKVFVTRVPPMRFLKDPSVNISNLEEAKWIGRAIDIPLVDLIEDDKLDVDDKLIKGYVGYGGKLGLREAKKQADMKGLTGQQANDFIQATTLNKSMLDNTSDEFKRSKYAKFVRIYEIFLRPTKKEAKDGSKGWILLISHDQPKPLREDEWGVKAEGWPAKVLQFNELNDNMFGLSDIEAYGSLVDQKNAIVNLQLRNAQENSKVWVGISKENASEEDIEHVQKGDNSIIIFDTGNPKDRMFVSSPSGMGSSELYLIDQRINKEISDKSGVTDLRKGFLQSGEESAASVKLRAMGSGARPAYRQDIMADFLKASLGYINQLNKQYMPYDNVVRIVGSLDLEWSEKPTKEEIQADVDVELDVISMLPENPEDELKALNTALMLAIDALQNPAIQQKLGQEGKMFNIAPLVEQMLLRMKIRDPDVFRQIRPEESQGFVSVAEVRAAKSNVEAALSGSEQIPSPPAMGQDHVARMEVYSSILQLIQQMGDTIANRVLSQLMQIHQALLQQEMDKEATPNMKLQAKKPKLQVMGAT